MAESLRAISNFTAGDSVDRLPPDDDGIPLEGFEDRPKRRPRPAKPLHKPEADESSRELRCGPCWVCQAPTFSDKCAIVAGRILPVCIDCWESIPPAERIKIGLAMIADDDMRPLKQIAAVVLSKIRCDAERAVDRDGDPFGIFGSGN